MVSTVNSPPSDTKSNKSGKKKYKKDALEYVDYETEFKRDPKFKTELCKTFSDTGFCCYGNKCRFAHGKEELFGRTVEHPKYRKSDCITFHTNGFCNYGQRCHFRHNDTRKLQEIPRSYYSLLNLIPGVEMKKISSGKNMKNSSVRLEAFKTITNIEESKNNFNNPKFNKINQFQYANEYVNNIKRLINLNNPSMSGNLPISLSHKINKTKNTLLSGSERKSSDSSSIQSQGSISSAISPEDTMIMSRFMIGKTQNTFTGNKSKFIINNNQMIGQGQGQGINFNNGSQCKNGDDAKRKLDFNDF
jgi:hypothetical protein